MKVVPPDDEGPPVSSLGALSRDELIDLVERILRVEGTETEHQALVRRFEQSVPRPGASDLIYWPERRADGAPHEMSAAQIVDAALAYRAIELGP
ncbi:bacteriocin immunity protein [Solirubrobacter taibaiensis]|nr:bacteriocin immunity protein [Solirubrobacter taibaiensis]